MSCSACSHQALLGLKPMHYGLHWNTSYWIAVNHYYCGMIFLFGCLYFFVTWLYLINLSFAAERKVARHRQLEDQLKQVDGEQLTYAWNSYDGQLLRISKSRIKFLHHLGPVPSGLTLVLDDAYWICLMCSMFYSGMASSDTAYLRKDTKYQQ